MVVRNTTLARGTTLARDTSRIPRTLTQVTPAQDTMTVQSTTMGGDTTAVRTMVVQGTTLGQAITRSRRAPTRAILDRGTTRSLHIPIQATRGRDPIRSRRRPHTTTLFLTHPSHRHLRPRDRIRR